MRRSTLLFGAGGIAAAGLGWAVADYRAWRALGQGGLPSSWPGWWRMTRLRMAKRDPFACPPLDTDATVSLLADLPRRRGERPRVAPHPVPHRQLEARSPAPIIDALQTLFEDKVRADPTRLSLATSFYEKHNQAVTLAAPWRRNPDARDAHGEVGHVHPSDGSMHMILSPVDARVVIKRGWGERHGLAGIRLGLPRTYMMIYAPRDDADLGPVSSMLDAAIAYMASEPFSGVGAAS